jgi:hypothetical protein
MNENIDETPQSGDNLPLHFNATIELRGPDGEVKQREQVHNLITTAGRTALLSSTGSSKYVKDFSNLAIGSSATAPAIGDTALVSQLARAAATVTNPNATTLRFVREFAAGVGTGTVQEAGLLDDPTTGTLLNRLTFGAVTKGAGDTLTVTIDCTIS